MNASSFEKSFHLFAMPFSGSYVFFYFNPSLFHLYFNFFVALVLPYSIKLTGIEAAHAVSDCSCFLSQ